METVDHTVEQGCTSHVVVGILMHGVTDDNKDDADNLHVGDEGQLLATDVIMERRIAHAKLFWLMKR